MTEGQRLIKAFAIVFAVILILGIFSGILGLLSGLSYLFDKEAPTDIPLSGIAVTSAVNALDVDIAAADFEIKRGDALSIESNHKYLQIEEDDGVLEISEKKRLITTKSEGYKVILYIPQDLNFSEVDITTGAGKLSISDLSANELDLELGAGKADLDRVSVYSEVSIDGGAGELNINNSSFYNLSLNIGVGNSNLNTSLKGNSTVNCGVGATDITLIGAEADYKVSFDKGIGEAKVKGENIKDGTIIGTGTSFVDINCGIGSVSLDFKQ